MSDHHVRLVESFDKSIHHKLSSSHDTKFLENHPSAINHAPLNKNVELYDVTIWLESTKDVLKVIDAYEKKDSHKKSSSDERYYWFCWTIFDQTYQSPEFSLSSGNVPNRMKHHITIECSSSHILQRTIEDASLRVFLCTNEKILAKSDVKIQFHHSHDNSSVSIDHAMTLSMPFQWFDMNLLFKSKHDEEIHASVEVGVDIHHKSSSSTSHDNDYNNVERIKSETDEAAAMEYSNATGVDHQDDHDVDNSSQYQSRRYRLSIDVRSIASLKRPAYAGVAFTYPHLGYIGTSTMHAPVRTHPMWVVANSEAKIDQAKVSYDFCMNRQLLEEVARNNPLKVHITSRSHLGSEIIGDVIVDLISVVMCAPVLYRCPISGRQFKTMKDYQSYRYQLVTAAATNRIERLPPHDPVVIHAVDGYYPVIPAAAEVGATPATMQGAKLRVVLILEDLGIISSNQMQDHHTMTDTMKPGVYVPSKDHKPDHDVGPADPLQLADLSPQERSHLESLRLDWENWRKASEIAWMTSLKEKETSLRASLQEEMNKTLEDRGAHLKAAQEETSRLEIRLRQAIEVNDRQKNQLILKEEQMKNQLAQKSEELQLLQRRVRDEAKIKIETEVRKVEGLRAQVRTLEEALDRMEKRAVASEKEYESYRNYSKSTPENLLREENIRLKVQLSESKLENERERRLRSEGEAEKEHYKAQVHRVATALKRERDKTAIVARQEIEQMRLEFLNREERYILDGDRDELRNIRHELASLRSNMHTEPSSNTRSYPISVLRPATLPMNNLSIPQPSSPPSYSAEMKSRPLSPDASTATPAMIKANQIRQQIAELRGSGLYDDDDAVLVELNRSLMELQAS